MDISELVKRVSIDFPSKLLSKSESIAGSDLNKVMFSFVQVKEILYQSLMDIEIEEIRKKWERGSR